MERLSDLRVADAQILLALPRHESSTLAARALELLVSDVEDAIARVEAEVGVTLVRRHGERRELTPAGKRLEPQLAAIVERARLLRSGGDGRPGSWRRSTCRDPARS